ncbi:MAG: D-alanyl-D-alanine carboxypeptidase [Gammaproteobacteria bacterium]|nr:D-alanyl-D-alanine carboxypeptidase [Gammaproteobacteria bacterium]MCP5423915.1 D-alanyl-D-alanine carboxypeptidase [Gammaproteobacteria bacterium]MCP5459394.1 D-alanyl-D-alanine carboxypeptidase [Gammaproteobacteria bacterium]
MVLPVWAMAASPPDITARAAVVMDMASGEVLFARQPQQPLPPASTTKVLTALVALERLNPNTRITVSESAAAVEPSRIGLHAGEVLYAQDLFYGLLLKSGNDAAEVIAQAVGGAIPTFAELMNIRAWQIGARHSHFANPHGLPNSDHYTTAFDLALIFREAMQNPMFAEIVRTRSAELRVEPGYQFRGNVRWVPVRNSNRLLYSYAGNQGGKTGYTRLARNCYVGEASRGDVNLIVSVLGSTNRNFLWKDVSALFDYGFALRDKSAPATPTLLLTGSATRNESLKAD